MWLGVYTNDEDKRGGAKETETGQNTTVPPCSAQPSQTLVPRRGEHFPQISCMGGCCKYKLRRKLSTLGAVVRRAISYLLEYVYA